jgi:prepilin-type N-terminal cleavage/methylation domain-containing protein
MSRRQRFAFTLIELLTVIAITAVLLTIIVVPVIQSFNLTRQAQAFADAQDRARVLAERISREVGNSVGVRDLSNYVTANINGQLVNVPANSIAVVVPSVTADGSVIAKAPSVQVLLPYSKLDILQPAQGAILGSGQYINPNTGFVDPTLTAPKGQVTLPLGQGMSMVRYWIGLRQPTADDGLHALPYNDPYSGLLMNSSGQDNLFVLYRAEVQPYTYQGSAYKPNTNFFQVDSTNPNLIGDEDDPNFFSYIPGVDVATDGTYSLTGSGINKAKRIAQWQKAARLVSDFSRYDLVLPIYDKSSRKIRNIGGVPQLISMAQFRPTRITAETVAGQTATRLGDESVSGAAVSPDVFVTSYGHWSNPVVRTYPIGWTPGTSASIQSDYEVGRRDINLGNSIFFYQPGIDTGDDLSAGIQLFSLDAYDKAVSTGTSYPFTQAVNTAALNATTRQIFTPYTMNRKSGKIIASFGINEVGLGNPVNSKNTNNLPMVDANPTGVTSAYTPSTDPTLNANPTFASYPSINEKFNKIWNDFPGLRPNIHRFIDLRVQLQGDQLAYSPLYPDPIAGQPTGLGHVLDSSGNTIYSRASIVPGSDQVTGPDELPGPNYGNLVSYTRVTQNPGPNQYCINYTDLPQPTDGTGAVNYSIAFPGFNNPKTTYDPTDFSTAVLQPRYKAGYIQLCSDPNVPIPVGSNPATPAQIQVFYRFQITGKLTGYTANAYQAQAAATAAISDSFAVDYDSRQLIDVLLTVRNYPQSTNNPNPQTVTLKSTASVRNYQR